MQRDFQQRGSFHPDAVSLQGRLSENASIIDSSDLRALEEANEQLYVLLPMSKQIPSMIVYVATENAPRGLRHNVFQFYVLVVDPS